MRNLLNRRGVRWLLAVGIVAVLASCVGVLLLRRPAAAHDSVEMARARWAGRGFDAYTLTLRQETRDGVCDQRIETQGERATRAARNSCGQPPNWTVTRLLNWIVELERTPSRCYPGPSACACQVMASTMVSYDSALGYPRTITYEWRSRPNLINPAYWRMLTDKTFPGCSNIQGSGTGGALVVNVRLEPEP
ncbi:hypothetical protein K2Z83_22360 [Oscillochloris sp. ZM17-4]|uniref:hypothetical protein n=1 Tax=Oscillochloris sp. ZM17-4 TaxID=2866714 RepID=UPI001C730EEB|nr:hypothetical protein [Oscillochloris sp. ZM17-4]MBX0330408.1 hypothetical protein [Oscillochloris sp. ZM17-4]